MPPRQPTRAIPVEVIDPRWILKAIGLTLLAALVCGYLTLCLLFYQGQWQLVLHPIQTAQPLDHLGSLPATPVRFDAATTGLPRLSGAFIPSAQPSRYSSYTVLFFRGGDASLATSPGDVATFAMLHGLGPSLFVFDYRGFGDSDPTHPSLLSMTEDAQASFRYLLGRGIPETHILLYGTGVGASLATAFARTHPSIPALILDDPPTPTIALVQADPRTRALPVRWLFHEDFTLAGLAALPTPKLLISYSPAASTAIPPAFAVAANPKTTVELPAGARQQRASAIIRFLDQFLPTSTP